MTSNTTNVPWGKAHFDSDSLPGTIFFPRPIINNPGTYQIIIKAEAGGPPVWSTLKTKTKTITVP